MKLLPPTKKRTALEKSWNKQERVTAELLRCATAGLTRKEILILLKTARQEKMEVARACKPRGRAKGGGQSSKAKGRAAVVLVRDLLQRTFGLKDDDLLVKATSMAGVDLHLSPYAQSYFPFAIETKAVEKLSLWAALAQATVNAKKKQLAPAVFFKRAHSPLYVAFRAEDLLEHLRGD
jgi:hypothetical protein